MKIYVKHQGETCELLKYQNTQGQVEIKSPSEGWLRVNKNQVEVVGVRNGKGDTGDYKKVAK